MASDNADPNFPCSLVLSIPLPTYRLASSALRALEVDAELSPLVQRSFSLTAPEYTTSRTVAKHVNDSRNLIDHASPGAEERTILRTEYKATTNRMLRVAVNGFMESLGVILEVMQELDVDVLVEGGLS
ncbi:hypothetical protein MMC12_006115 [Toensbergia leucococca]|nr:hypothetical protein [Toensbergia leucococca]